MLVSLYTYIIFGSFSFCLVFQRNSNILDSLQQAEMPIFSLSWIRNKEANIAFIPVEDSTENNREHSNSLKTLDFSILFTSSKALWSRRLFQFYFEFYCWKWSLNSLPSMIIFISKQILVIIHRYTKENPHDLRQQLINPLQKWEEKVNVRWKLFFITCVSLKDAVALLTVWLENYFSKSYLYFSSWGK